VLKVAGLLLGTVAVLLALGYSYDELSFLAGSGSLGVRDVLLFLALSSLAFSGLALIAQLPESLRARFIHLPVVFRRKPVYGFGTMLAVGVGATLGSPLFILIPLNIEQYEAVSLVSLLIATILSVAMAKVYADMYKESKELGLEGVGGPSFVKVAVGKKSVRYFLSRLSMWVANTALAAYTKIVFLVFDFVFMPSILAGYGFSPQMGTIITYLIAGAFVGWTLINVLFEQKYLRALGVIQVGLTALLIALLLYHTLVLGTAGRWNLAGIFGVPTGFEWVPALVINTGYLYLLFFGFQEIQALERDAVERSKIPVVSWVKKGFTLDRTTYFGVAMVVSVVVAAAINILYGLAVYSAHPDLSSCTTSCIPALFLAQKALGGGEELLVAIAFLIATVTTFVPAFLAAARHLAALGEDGYMPASLASLSWVFTLAAIFLLAIGNQNFLVNITDFMVLISLGIISYSGVWLKKRVGPSGGGSRALSVLVGSSCFLFGGAVYFKDPLVVVFGSLAVILAYLVFDVIELGSLGAQLFLSVFGLVCVAAVALFEPEISITGLVSSATQFLKLNPSGLLLWGLFLSSILLLANVVVDVKVLRRTSVS
jgi:amino acid transporter